MALQCKSLMDKKPEIGYHIRKDCQRRGYASEAARAVRDWTFMNAPFNDLFLYEVYECSII